MVKKALILIAMLLFGTGLYVLPATANSSDTNQARSEDTSQIALAKPAKAVELNFIDGEESLDDILDEIREENINSEDADTPSDTPIGEDALPDLIAAQTAELEQQLADDDRTLDELIKDSSLSPEHRELVQAKLTQDRAEREQAQNAVVTAKPAVESTTTSDEEEDPQTAPETTVIETETTPGRVSDELVQEVADRLAEAVEADPSLKGALDGDNPATTATTDVQPLEVTAERARVRRNGSLRVALDLLCEPNAFVNTRILFSTADTSLTSVLTGDRCSVDGAVEVEVILQDANVNPDADSVSARVTQSTGGNPQGAIVQKIEFV